MQIEFRGEKVNIQTEKVKNISNVSYRSFLKIYQDVIDVLQKSKDKRDDSKVYTSLKELATYDNILARLIETYIYLEYQNSAKAQATIKNLLGHDYYEHIFLSDLHALSAEKQTEMTLFLLRKLSNSNISKNALDALIFYIHFNSTSELRDQLDQEFDIAKSITQVQRKYKTVLYGQELPFVWAPSLFENSSRKEYVRFVREFYKDKEVKRDAELLLFRTFPALEKQRKNGLLKLFSTLKNSKSTYSQFVYFTLLEDERFYRFATSGSSPKVGLLISEKRKFLLSLLKLEGIKEYGLLSLLSIGDVDKSYIENHILIND